MRADRPTTSDITVVSTSCPYTSNAYPDGPPLSQPHKQAQHRRIIRRAQSRHGIPAARRKEPRGPTPTVIPDRDIVQDLGIGVQRRIDEPNAVPPHRQSFLVDPVQDRRERRRGRGGPTDEFRDGVDRDDHVVTDGREIRVSPSSAD